MKAYGQVYKITNLLNGKVYIGQTTLTLAKRLQGHRTAKTAFGKAMRLARSDNFTIEALCTCSTPSALGEAERHLMETYNSLEPHGYNINQGSILHRRSGKKTPKRSKVG